MSGYTMALYLAGLRSIPVRFFTQTLLVRPLCAVSSLAQLGPVLSASPEILHLLGFDHQRLTYRYAGRDFRLTDVHGQVIRSILA